jgi:transposase
VTSADDRPYRQWPSPPIRVDREQLEAALRPVVAAISTLEATIQRLAPALDAIVKELQRMAQAAESAEDRAVMEPRRKR